MDKVIVAYWSQTGNTAAMAAAIGEGITEACLVSMIVMADSPFINGSMDGTDRGEWSSDPALFGGRGLVQPLLALHQAGDQHGGDGVAGGVQAGGGGVEQEAQGGDDGEGLGGEVEHGDDQHLAHQAASGGAGEDEGGQDSHHDGHAIGARAGEVHAEHAVEESDLGDGAEYGAVHVHGAAHGQHQIADVLGHADAVTGLLVHGDGGGGGLGGKGGDGGAQDVFDHGRHTVPAAGQEGVEGEEDHPIEGAQGVVDQHGAAVVADDLGAVGGHQVGEVGAQADWGHQHDDAHELHDDVVQVGQQPAHGALLAAAGGDAEAEEDGEDDEGQHVGLVPQVGEVGHGEGADQQLAGGLCLAHLAGHQLDGGAR